MYLADGRASTILFVLDEEIGGEVVVEILALKMESIDLPVVHVGATIGAGVRWRRYFCNRARRSSLRIAPTLRSSVIIARSCEPYVSAYPYEIPQEQKTTIKSKCLHFCEMIIDFKNCLG